MIDPTWRWQAYLRSNAYTFQRLDGAMRLEQRTRALQAFSGDPTCTVFLISLHCGSLGLNLQAASQVILVRPRSSWNACERSEYARARWGRTGHRKVRPPETNDSPFSLFCTWSIDRSVVEPSVGGSSD